MVLEKENEILCKNVEIVHGKKGVSEIWTSVSVFQKDRKLYYPCLASQRAVGILSKIDFSMCRPLC